MRDIPIGLRPEWIAEICNNTSRIIEITDAITRYAEANKPIPVEWCKELNRRITDKVINESKSHRAEFEPVDELDRTARGEGGFGSTGKQ